jgi:hypothetical protein
MNDISELFWSASIENIKKGYIHDMTAEVYICLLCGQGYEKGIIYRKGEDFYEAEKYMTVHISDDHESVFTHLLNLNKKWTGLTDNQKNLLSYFQQGLSDAEIVKQLDGGSTSTIRNHRFLFREKEKQAKVFLAIMGLLDQTSSKKQQFVNFHRYATMQDERYAITKQENDEILSAYFNKGLDGPLSEFPKKQKRKIAILKHLSKRFKLNVKYTEKQVNESLKQVFDDYVTLRRYLIEYGFMDRKDDSSLYWLKI